MLNRMACCENLNGNWFEVMTRGRLEVKLCSALHFGKCQNHNGFYSFRVEFISNDIKLIHHVMNANS